MMLWTEPARSNAKRSSQLSTVWLGETAFSEIRRFVVIGEGHGNVICSPIHSYGGQATLKENLPDLEQHAIIHTSSEAPAGRCEYDAAGYIIAQEQLSKVPIRVIQELNHADGDLGDCSRINYAKIYTVEKYVRVLNIGRVHESSMDALLASSFFARPKDQPVQGPRRSAHKPRDNRERKEEPRDERDSNKRGQSSSSGGQHHHRRK
ncbi:uncharacterized protein LY89DRAFT_660871 [Mollisia scopiformis]|uniref:DUF6590 domain-containing protein n=1 Tax=Mollisia scopiformis TaxID=149040 RepID=A0A132B3Z7_MOLSC|nr:uncharacterized protein LY89DRAFT_660871 [Mollisia scopiformis]KUJ07135.1 hypothetical protein LY89DRAFT_660871 [Mollisia scopiformis]